MGHDPWLARWLPTLRARAAAELHYRVEGAPKRFFDRTDIDALFAHGWRVVGIEHLRTAKYGAPKALWELALESSPGYRPGGA